MTTLVQQTLPFSWQGGRQCNLQLLIQPWSCAPGTLYGWVGRGTVEYEVYLTLLHMPSPGNRTPDLLILSPTPYSLGHMLPQMDACAFCGYESLLWGYICGFCNQENGHWNHPCGFSMDRHRYLVACHCHTKLKLDGWLTLGFTHYLFLECSCRIRTPALRNITQLKTACCVQVSNGFFGASLFCCIVCKFLWIFCIAQVVIPVCAGSRE